MNGSRVEREYQVVVVGGGISGVCAALASARHGAQTALIQDRPVLGGNASSEIRMHICGANREGSRENARETGIIEEILLENQARNPQHSFSVCDTILWEKCAFQENLHLYLNTRFLRAEAEEGRVRSIWAHQLTTEKDFRFSASLFIDATGDGMLAEQAGAQIMRGREGKAEFSESLAPERHDDYTMGNSILFTAKDMGHPVPFRAPAWAYHYDDADIPGHLYHNHGTVKEATSGYWWLELGGDERNSLDDYEAIRDELLKTLYGVWDHLKNQDQGCENLALDWVGFLPGKRESRRVVGEYVLRQDDLVSGRHFADNIAYGGWHLDVHPVGGFAAFHNFEEASEEERALKMLKQIYGIPYRCLLPKGMKNLLMAGRAISVTHIAFGSTRVMATCGLVGQAAGTAAALCARHNCAPAALSLSSLQAALMLDDCYLPGQRLSGSLLETARLLCSSQQVGYEAEMAVNGRLRAENGVSNCWRAAAEDPAPWLEARWPAAQRVRKIILRFDSNCSRHYCISLSAWMREHRIYAGIPEELVKDYALELFQGENRVWQARVSDNYQRLNVHILPPGMEGDWLRLTIHSSHGTECARLFQWEAYVEK